MITTSRIEAPPFVVGIGASAEGLEALDQFFNHMRPNTGAAFVVALPLPPANRSLAAERLASRVRMAVHIAEDGMELARDRIYLVPLERRMIVSDGVLRSIRPGEGSPLPIDLCFESLAKDFGPRAIGVLLTAASGDGARGIAAIKESGGLAFAQEPPSIPTGQKAHYAASIGLVDAVGAPDAICRRIASRIDAASVRTAQTLPVPDRPPSDEQLSSLFKVLKEKTDVDFKDYKRPGVIRRIQRRMSMNRVADYDAYVELLRNDAREFALLQQDLLIGVTQFFRDRKAFERLAEGVIPLLFESKRDDREIRVWVAGCSTGEEAYTLAMLIQEHMATIDLKYNVKIFATDLDKQSIRYASEGEYPQSIEHSVPPELLAKYFAPKQNAYVVREELRKTIVFATHDITRDPPFINMDLITCRNMLIYLQPNMQQRVLSLFHFALNPKAFLFLGPSETIGRLGGLFTTFDRKWNIFRQNEAPAGSSYDAIGISDQLNDNTGRHHAAELAFPSRPARQQRQSDELLQLYLDEHVPPSVVIDERLDVVRITGNIDPFVALTKGKPSLNVRKMFPGPLSVAIATSVHKIRKEGGEIVYPSFRTGAADAPPIDLTIRPFSKEHPAYKHLTLVTFAKSQWAASTPDSMDLDHAMHRRVADLEQALLRAEESLQMTVEELETSNEELQATNEELVASNEELQSANEELQSVNEELLTVNSEYQRKIQEMIELNNDMDNFLTSTNIGTIFLDTRMCVRRFTPAVTREIHLLDIDVGRPISHIRHHFQYDEWVADAARVLETLEPIEKEIKSDSGKWYSLRIMPYRTAEQLVQGTVVTFVDITDLKMLNNELQIKSYAIEQSLSIVVIADLNGAIQYVNPKFLKQTGYRKEDVVGKKLHTTNLWELSNESFKDVWDGVRRGRKWAGQLQGLRADGSTYWEELSLVPIYDLEGQTIHILKVAEDITDRKQSEEMLRRSEMLSAVGQLAAGIAHEIRNPLTSLKGFTKLIKSGKTDAKYLDIMSKELERIESIISELLMLSKNKVANYLPNELNAILADVKLLLEPQAILNNVEIHCEFDPNLPVVFCNENELKQVFINLLKNGIESMPKGGKLLIRTENVLHQKARILFIDEGVGIPKEILARLGEPFYTTKEKGTGLGLMICYQIIEDAQGTLRFSSETGAGTTVEIVLPAYQHHNPEDAYDA